MAEEVEDATAVIAVQDGFGLSNVESLDFGTVILGSLGGTVDINAGTGTVSTVGDVTLGGTDRHRARYTLSAPVSQVMVLSGDPSVTLTHTNGTDTLTANLTYAGGSGLATALVFGLPIGLQATAATQELYAGGMLIVPAGSPEGYYEGEFDITLAYL